MIIHSTSYSPQIAWHISFFIISILVSWIHTICTPSSTITFFINFHFNPPHIIWQNFHWKSSASSSWNGYFRNLSFHFVPSILILAITSASYPQKVTPSLLPIFNTLRASALTSLNLIKLLPVMLPICLQFELCLPVRIHSDHPLRAFGPHLAAIASPPTLDVCYLQLHLVGWELRYPNLVNRPTDPYPSDSLQWYQEEHIQHLLAFVSPLQFEKIIFQIVIQIFKLVKN